MFQKDYIPKNLLPMWEDLNDIDSKKQKPPEHFDIAEPPTEAVADAEEHRKDLETLEDIKKRFDLDFPEIDKKIEDKKKLLEEMAPETTSANLLRKSRQAQAQAKAADERLEKHVSQEKALLQQLEDLQVAKALAEKEKQEYRQKHADLANQYAKKVQEEKEKTEEKTRREEKAKADAEKG